MKIFSQEKSHTVIADQNPGIKKDRTLFLFDKLLKMENIGLYALA